VVPIGADRDPTHGLSDEISILYAEICRGPTSVLIHGYGSASSALASPSPINYLAVRLKVGERWRYDPPTGHSVLWVSGTWLHARE
jgi:hypothetical protein